MMDWFYLIPFMKCKFDPVWYTKIMTCLERIVPMRKHMSGRPMESTQRMLTPVEPF